QHLASKISKLDLYCRDSKHAETLSFPRLERFERLERLERMGWTNSVIYANLSVRGGRLCVMSSTINHPSRAAASLLGCHWKTPARITSTSLAIQVSAVQGSSNFSKT